MLSRTKKRVRKAFQKYAAPEVKTLIQHFRSTEGAVFAHRNVRVTATAEPGPVLVLAPHPDDEAVGLGGVLSSHLHQSSRVTVAYLTDGAGSSGRFAEVRRKEAEALASSEGFEAVFVGAQDTKLTNEPKVAEKVAAVVAEVRPDIVYAPSFFEHQYDHFATNQILVDAMARSPHKPRQIASYEVWDHIPLPNYIVDISAHFDRKLKMIQYYATPLRDTDYPSFCRNRNAATYFLHVSSKRTNPGYAEAFHLLETDEYVESYSGYLQALIQNNSLIPKRIQVTSRGGAIA